MRFPFNPFALALGSSSSASSARLPLDVATPLLRAGNRVPAGAGAAGSGGSGGSAGSVAKLLQRLGQEAPEWMLEPSRLDLERGADGQLVLLGRGYYSCVYRGWLLPGPDGEGPAGATPSAAAGAGTTLAATVESGGGGGGAGNNERRVAVKVLNAAGDMAAFVREAGMLHRLRGSPHMVPLLGACALGDQLLLVTELLEVRRGGAGVGGGAVEA